MFFKASKQIDLIFFSFNHDLARSGFQFEIVSPSEAIVGAIIENMILPDLVLCYVPQVLEKKIGKKLKSLHSLGGEFREFFLKKASYDVGSVILSKKASWWRILFC